MRLFAAFSSGIGFPKSERIRRNGEKDKFSNQNTSISVFTASNPVTLNSSVAQQPIFVRKLRNYLKLILAIRIRSSFLPRLTFTGRQKQNYARSSRRQALVRFNFTRRTKIERRRKFVRLQPVHFIRPSYIQRDFRTLQAVLVHTPTSEEIPFPFRGSLNQIETFYHSRGILFFF